EQMCADLARDNPTFAEPNISDADLRRMWDRMRVLQELRAAKLKDNDFEGYLSTFDGHKRFAGFRAAAHRMRDPDYWRCLNLTWDNIEISYLDLDAWVALFESKRGQRYELMSEADRGTFARLPDRLKIFRGYAHSKAKNGLSWSLSEAKARWFADYAGGGRRLYLCGPGGKQRSMLVSGQCFKRDVLAYFNEREEQEIVIHP